MDDGPLYGLVPFDLQAPVALLYPGGVHDRACRQRTVELGHKSGHRLVLQVPCGNMPHCHSCECGDGHAIYLSAEQEAGLKALLP